MTSSPTAHQRATEAAIGVALGTLAVLLAEIIGIRAIMGVHRPLLVALLIMALGGAAGFVGVARWFLALDLAMIAVALVAVSPLMDGPVDRWVRDDSAAALIARPTDAIVVLSGSIESDSTISASSLDRLLTGLGLFEGGAGRRLITTRVAARIGGRRVTTDADQARLVRLARADSAWAVVGPVATTRDEALHVARFFARSDSGVTRPMHHTIVVVTSPLHTRRACATFEGVGFAVVCRAAREREWVTWHARTAPDRLAAFRDYVYERLGMIKYRYEGWVR